MGRYGSEYPETLKEILDTLSVEDLKSLGSQIQKKLPSRHGEIVEFLCDQMKADKIPLMWQRLNDIERKYLSEVVHSGEQSFDPERFKAKYGQDVRFGTKEDYRYRWDDEILFFMPRGIMPLELIPHVKKLAQIPPPAQIHTIQELPQHFVLRHRQYDYIKKKDVEEVEERALAIRLTERDALRDLPFFLGLVDVGKVSVSGVNRVPTESTVRYLSSCLQGGDFYDEREHKPDQEKVGAIKAFAWPLLLQASGWAQPFGSKLKLTKAGLKALSEAAPSLIKHAYGAWLGSVLSDEYARIPVVRGQTGSGKRGMTDVRARRNAIEGALLECPSGAWIAVDEFCRTMRAAGHDFEVTRNPWDLYILEKQYGTLGYEGYGSWEILQKRYVLAFLFEYLATLGLIDVAYVLPHDVRREDYSDMWGTDDVEFFSRYDGLLYFRINSLGRFCLEQTNRYEGPQIEVCPKALKVLSTHEIAFRRDALTQGDLIFLERMSEPVSEGVVKLSAPKWLERIAHGVEFDRLVQFLEDRSETPLPDNVRRYLADIQARSGCLKDRGHVRLIEVSDAALAQLLAMDTNLAGLCMRAGERHLVIWGGKEKAFSQMVKKLGYVLPSLPEKA